MNIIQTKGAPAAIGPYSQGISTGRLLFTSGQLPVNPADGAMPEGIAAQAEWSCKNVGAILELLAPVLKRWSRPPAFWPTLPTLPLSTRYMPGILPPSLPAPVWR